MSSLLSQQVNETFRDALLAFYLYTFDPLKTDKAPIESAPRSTPEDLYNYWLLDGRSQGASATPHVRCCHVYPIQPPEYRGARHHYGDALSTTDAA
ncbi:hypothetical protein, partial [Pseudomonas lundensis]|uniref:hypothetical protein n=1 Tax=Pseudomonas lundensis TaxID=86185 RepID=UPI0019D36DC1